MRNNLYYVLLVVPLQTALALGLALVVNQQVLKGKGFFRTAFYFPSVTSSVAISTSSCSSSRAAARSTRCWSSSASTARTWFTDSHGLTWTVLDGTGLVDLSHPPHALTGSGMLGLSWWDWLAGPSVAMCAIIMLASGPPPAPSC